MTNTSKPILPNNRHSSLLIFFKSSCKHVFYLALVLTFFACNDTIPGSTSQALHKQNTEDWPEHFGFGKPASAQQIAAIDIDIRPDGQGLPPGSGTVPQGRAVYLSKCAACHGNNGYDGPFNHLVQNDTSKAKAIGNYWPYATTVFDYIRRAMPFTSPGSLTNEEVYHVTAYLLNANKLIDSNMVINATNLPKIAMPAKKLFVPDDRKDGPEIR